MLRRDGKMREGEPQGRRDSCVDIDRQEFLRIGGEKMWLRGSPKRKEVFDAPGTRKTGEKEVTIPSEEFLVEA